MSDQIFQRAQAAHLAGNADEAERLYRDALAEMPDHAEALRMLGVLLLEYRNNPTEAQSLIGRALAVNPQDASYYQNYAMALSALGDNAQAVAALERALTLNPGYTRAWFDLGNVLMSLSRPQDALACFQRAIALNPHEANTFCAAAHSLTALVRSDEAIAYYEEATRLKPDLAQAMIDVGFLHQQAGRFSAALRWCDRALKYAPQSADAHNNRGTALFCLARTEEALISFNRAAELSPAAAHIRINAGYAYQVIGRFAQALAEFDAAHAIAPEMTMLKGVRLFADMNVCRWANFSATCQELIKDMEQGGASADPFQFLCLPTNAAQQRKCAEIYAAEKYPSQESIRTRPARKSGRLRIAYVSKDFYNHPTAALLTEVLEQHDRAEFEIFGISHGMDDKSPQRLRMANAFERFVDVSLLGDRQIAAAIADRDIDIAIELDGYTMRARPAILSFRPARLQVSFLGFPGTMGAAHIDYLIADAVVVPPGDDKFFSEKIIRMPHSYQPNGRRPLVPTSSRQDAGLPDKAFVFGCFNNSFKITPDAFDSWMRILARVPDSVLWLLFTTDLARDNLMREAQARGVDPARLIFAPRVDADAHAARLVLVDVVLDTFTYGAHTTASDALWAGVPVVTRLGEAFAGRVAASLLTVVGLPELITQTAQEYENLAVALAGDPARLAALKLKLRNNRDSTPLFDAARYARDLESAYRGIWAKHEAGEPPESLAISG